MHPCSRHPPRARKAGALARQLAVATGDTWSLPETLLGALRLICELGHWRLGHVYVADEGGMAPSGSWFSTDSAKHRAFQRATMRVRFAPGEGLVGRAAATRRPLWVPAVDAEPDWRREPLGPAGLHSLLLVPVAVHGTVRAVLELFGDAVRDDAEALYEEAREIAVHVGALIERREAEDAACRRAERERRRLGEELHDGLGQQLAGTTLLASSLARQLEQEGHAAAGAAARLVGELESAARQVRALSRELAPVEPDARGLRAALEHLCRAVTIRHGLPCVLRADPDVLVADREAATRAFRLARGMVDELRRTCAPDAPEPGSFTN